MDCVRAVMSGTDVEDFADAAPAGEQFGLRR
jgi:hypothetical protein